MMVRFAANAASKIIGRRDEWCHTALSPFRVSCLVQAGLFAYSNGPYLQPHRRRSIYASLVKTRAQGRWLSGLDNCVQRVWPIIVDART